MQGESGSEAHARADGGLALFAMPRAVPLGPAVHAGVLAGAILQGATVLQAVEFAATRIKAEF
eukprot:11221381-Lingulodinium_polyedra.AAC.1